MKHEQLNGIFSLRVMAVLLILAAMGGLYLGIQYSGWVLAAGILAFFCD
jgi:hypothetical protein